MVPFLFKLCGKRVCWRSLSSSVFCQRCCIMSSTRYSPYNGSYRPRFLSFWHGAETLVHPLKADRVNADAFFMCSHSMGVFDGVGSVAIPAAMSTSMCVQVDKLLHTRRSKNSTIFDRDTALSLMSSAPTNVQGTTTQRSSS